MIWLDRIISLSLVGFSFLIFLSSLRLGTGTLQTPGPGFTPFLSSILLLSLSLFVLIWRTKKSDEDGRNKLLVSWKNFLKPISVIIMLIAYILLLNTIGYLIGTFLLMFIMFFIYEPKKWYVHLFIGAIVASSSYFVFYKWFQVQLPTGILSILR